MNLPPDAPLERALIGCVVTDPLIALPELREHPAEEYFADHRYRLIFEAAQGLAEAGELVTNPSLQSALSARNQLFEGAPEIIAGLFADAPPPITARYYAEKLQALHDRRRKIEAAHLIDLGAREGDAALVERGEAILAGFHEGALQPLSAVLERCRFDPLLNPAPVRPVYSLAGAPICTPDNLATIAALAKAGKSAFVNALLAAPMAIPGSDTLGVSSSNPEGRAVVHVDTEQSPEDHWHQITRAIRRAGREQAPPWLQSYCLTGFDARRAREALWLAVGNAAKEFGGVHSVHVDGAADLILDVNDAAECNEFVAALHALAIQHDCPITCVIHFNPGTEKTRGHLGSQLERKAETNLRIDKDGEVSEVWSDKQRRAPILKGTGPRYAWSAEAGMHVTVERGPSAKEQAEVETLRNIRDDVFLDHPAMRYCDLEKRVQEVTKKSAATAERIYRKWVHFGLIEKGFKGLWTPRG